MPTIGRSVDDIAKLSPYASGRSIAGGDSRSTNLLVDVVLTSTIILAFLEVSQVEVILSH